MTGCGSISRKRPVPSIYLLVKEDIGHVVVEQKIAILGPCIQRSFVPQYSTTIQTHAEQAMLFTIGVTL